MGSVALFLWAKYRRSSSLGEWLPDCFFALKIAVFVCTVIESGYVAAYYTVAYLALFLTVAQGEDRTPNKVIQLNTGNFSQTVLDKDSNTEWLVEFYATWAPSCAPFTETYNKLSNTYTTDTFKFAKIDVGRYQSVAKQFDVSTSPLNNRELPTLILFRRGEPVSNQRMPVKTKDGRLHERYVLFTESNVKAFFKLENKLANQRKRRRRKDAKQAASN